MIVSADLLRSWVCARNYNRVDLHLVVYYCSVVQERIDEALVDHVSHTQHVHGFEYGRILLFEKNLSRL